MSETWVVDCCQVRDVDDYPRPQHVESLTSSEFLGPAETQAGEVARAGLCLPGLGSNSTHNAEGWMSTCLPATRLDAFRVADHGCGCPTGCVHSTRGPRREAYLTGAIDDVGRKTILMRYLQRTRRRRRNREQLEDCVSGFPVAPRPANQWSRRRSKSMFNGARGPNAREVRANGAHRRLASRGRGAESGRAPQHDLGFR